MRRNDPRVGIFGFLLVTLVLLGALVLFARYPGIFTSGREYSAVFRTVAGLNTGGDVRFGGLLVGTVTDMRFDPEHPTSIVVHFRVRSNTPVRADTRASITQVGFLGEPYLNLEPGLPDSPPLMAGATLPSEDNLTFQDAMSRLAAFFDRGDTLLAGAERIARASPLDRFDRTMARIDTLVTFAMSGSDRAFTSVQQASDQLTALLNRTDRLVAVLDTTVRRSGPGLATTQEEALRTVRELRMLVVDMRGALDAGGGVDQLVRNLSVTAENLAQITDRLERDPSSILKTRATASKPAGPRIRD